MEREPVNLQIDVTGFLVLGILRLKPLVGLSDRELDSEPTIQAREHSGTPQANRTDLTR